VYFTEADQLLMVRDFGQLYSWVEAHPLAALTPHRLIVAPEAFLKTQNKSSEPNNAVDTRKNPFMFSCCLDIGRYCLTRVHWKPVSDPSVGVVLIHGVAVIPGNANFPNQLYRSCNITNLKTHCPLQDF
jgi:hypothetical protein